MNDRRSTRAMGYRLLALALGFIVIIAVVMWITD